MRDNSAQHWADRDHPHRLAGKYRFGKHRDTVCGHVDLVRVLEQAQIARHVVGYEPVPRFSDLLYDRLLNAGLRPRAANGDDRAAVPLAPFHQGARCVSSILLVDAPVTVWTSNDH